MTIRIKDIIRQSTEIKEGNFKYFLDDDWRNVIFDEDWMTGILSLVKPIRYPLDQNSVNI